MFRLTLALCLASAVAFAPSGLPAASRVARTRVSAVEDMVGVGPETGGKVFDPLGLASMGSEETLLWYRACELKHGRVAMMATAGFMVHSLGITFPGYLSTSQNLKFSDLGTEPLAMLGKIPDAGKGQILFTILCVEVCGTRALAPTRTQFHRLRGDTLGTPPLAPPQW